MRGSIVILALAVLTSSCAAEECPDGFTYCERSWPNCVDLLDDNLNCGDCGNECEPGHICDEGACILSCTEGYADCDGVCRDLMNDRYNCGWCRLACHAESECVDGICKPYD